MKKLAMALVAVGFVSFSGLAMADSTAEKTTTSDDGATKTTKKTKKSHKASADGATTEDKTETKTKKEPAN